MTTHNDRALAAQTGNVLLRCRRCRWALRLPQGRGPSSMLPYVHCARCKREITREVIEGRYAGEEPCSRACRKALSIKCTCACGGSEHGADYSDDHLLQLRQAV